MVIDAPNPAAITALASEPSPAGIAARIECCPTSPSQRRVGAVTTGPGRGAASEQRSWAATQMKRSAGHLRSRVAGKTVWIDRRTVPRLGRMTKWSFAEAANVE